MEFENDFFRFNLRMESASFDLQSKQQTGMGFCGARLGVLFRKQGRKEETGGKWADFTIRREDHQNKQHGGMNVLSLSRGFSDKNIFLRITFALPESKPIFLWKMEMGNFGSAPIRLEKFVLLLIEAGNVPFLTFGNRGKTDLAFYSNGWQSWCRSAVYGEKERMWQTNVKLLQGPQWINPSTPTSRRRGHFASDFFTILGDRSSRRGWIFGFLSQRHQFGVITTRLDKRRNLTMFADGDDCVVPPGARVESDWAVALPIRLDDVDPMKEYIEAVGRENEIALTKPKPLGWSSWYEFYARIDEEKIQRNLDAVINVQKMLPMDLFQIDDGYERQVGDWLACKKSFPSGVAPFSRICKDHGLQAGLWQAPFIVHPRSKLAKQHPEWLLRNRWKGLANSGFNWNIFTTALDLTHPGVIAHIGKVIGTAVRAWGFSFLKLDFLYAAAIAGRHADGTQTRAQVIHTAMRVIRDSAGGETFLLGCGAPLGSMLGLVDGMRIGADMFEHWVTKVPGLTWFLKHEANAPSVRNAIQNILTRAMFHNRWWINDPDVLLLRETLGLNLHEIQSVASMIAMTGGMLMLSDNLPGISPARLRIAQQLIPPLDQRPWVLDWFDRQTPRRLRLELTGAAGEWWLISYSNWSDTSQDLVLHPRDYHLPEGPFMARSFWEKRLYEFSHTKPLKVVLAPHQTILLAVRRWRSSELLYLGSDLHVSQGLEVAFFSQKRNTTELTFRFPKRMSGSFDLYSPRMVKNALMEKKDISFEEIQEDVYRFSLLVDRQAKLILHH
jgi:alpha-galactosidase